MGESASNGQGDMQPSIRLEVARTRAAATVRKAIGSCGGTNENGRQREPAAVALQDGLLILARSLHRKTPTILRPSIVPISSGG
jgi:hypothetical protein